MEKNYYEILEVNEKASKEVIEKVYKILAKKYHPDLQEESQKQLGAEKFKEINEAYQTLSDSQKRQEYDKNLQNQKVSKEEYYLLYQENQELKNKINSIINQQFSTNASQNVENYQKKENYINPEYTREREEEMQQAYYDRRDQARRQYQEQVNQYQKEKIKMFFKDKLKAIVSILIIIFIIILILQLPFVKKYFSEMYESNSIIKAITDTIKNIFKF